jgi:hypothetical protein
MLAVVVVAAAPALAQDGLAVIADSTGDVPYAKAGGAEAKVDCPDGIMES